MVIAAADEVEVRPAGHVLDLQIDADQARLSLHRLRNLTPRIAERRKREREPLAAFLTDAVGVRGPAGGVENRASPRRIVAKGGFERVEPAPYAFRKRAYGHRMASEEELAHHRLSIDGPVERLA